MAKIEVLYSPANQAPLRAEVDFVTGMTVASMLEQSELLHRHPELVGMPVGIFSQRVQLEQLVKEGDRIEIYRPLMLDPMEKRRLRAKTSSRKS